MEKFSDIQVIIWDVDGTLYHTGALSTEVFEAAYKAIEECTGWPREKTVKEFDNVHKKITLSATEAVGIICNISTGDAAKLTDKYLDRLRFITQDERLILLFQKLSGFSHYILGNGSRDQIAIGLSALGLNRKIFKEIVTSELVGVNKPKDGGFKYIMEKSGKEASSHLMVGDRELVDLAPAKALGMKTCLVWAPTPSKIADITLPSVYDLGQILV